MMFLIDISTFTSVKMLLTAVPEPIELFAFGVVLVTGVGLLRSLLKRASAAKADKKLSEKSVTNN